MGSPSRLPSISTGSRPHWLFAPYADLALSPVETGFVHDLVNAKSASISIKDYNSPNADRFKLDGADPKVRSALKKCYKP